MEFFVIVAAIGGIIAFFVGLVVVLSILRGWVLSILWGWFMVPILGLPALSIPQAIGIAVVVGLLTHQSHSSPEDKNEPNGKKWGRMLEPLLSPWIALAFGWVVKQYM